MLYIILFEDLLIRDDSKVSHDKPSIPLLMIPSINHVSNSPFKPFGKTKIKYIEESFDSILCLSKKRNSILIPPRIE